MYQNIVILFITLMSFVLVAHSDWSLRCYKCVSLTDPDCGPDFRKRGVLYPEKCATSGPQACGKVQYRVPLVGELVTKRDCVLAPTENDLNNFCNRLGNHFGGGIIESCSACHTDGCNSAVTASPKLIYIILTALGSFLVAFIFNRNV